MTKLKKFLKRIFTKKSSKDIYINHINTKITNVDLIIKNTIYTFLDITGGEELIEYFEEEMKSQKIMSFFILDFIIKNNLCDAKNVKYMYQNIVTALDLCANYRKCINALCTSTKKKFSDEDVQEILTTIQNESKMFKYNSAFIFYEKVPGLYETLERANNVEPINDILYSITN